MQTEDEKWKTKDNEALLEAQARSDCFILRKTDKTPKPLQAASKRVILTQLRLTSCLLMGKNIFYNRIRQKLTLISLCPKIQVRYDFSHYSALDTTGSI